MPVDNIRTLLLVPSVAKRGIEAEVEANRHPTMDYYALQTELHADIADYKTVSDSREPLVRTARRAGQDAALAAYAWLHRREYDAIYSNGENVSIPLAALFTLGGPHPAHALIGHHLSTRKKGPFLKRLHRHMDRIFVYSTIQMEYAIDRLGIPASKLTLIPFQADARFFSPQAVPEERMICSAGLEWRDYPTLIEAVTGIDVEVKLAAASPWSKHRNETKDRTLPPNVTARRLEYNELRNLYARAAIVVVPLYENDFQAGVTTILEAMAVGRPVIVTRTRGQVDVIQHGENGLYVPPGDVAALRNAITHLLDNQAERQRLGTNGRQTVLQSMTLKHWVDRIATGVRDAVETRTVRDTRNKENSI